MTRKKILILLTCLIFVIFILNLAAGKFFWYSSIWYFDMPMHFLGGFWLALAFIWLIRPFRPSLDYFFKVIGCILAVGVTWEIFELIFVNYVAQNPFNMLDTFSDICFDLAGGISAGLYVLSRRDPNRV